MQTPAEIPPAAAAAAEAPAVPRSDDSPAGSGPSSPPPPRAPVAVARATADSPSPGHPGGQRPPLAPKTLPRSRPPMWRPPPPRPPSPASAVEAMKETLSRWGKSVGETTKMVESLSRDTWQHWLNSWLLGASGVGSQVVIPLHQLRAANPSVSKVNPAEKYIQVVSVEGHEFWFMGFLMYDKAGVQAAVEMGIGRGMIETDATAVIQAVYTNDFELSDVSFLVAELQSLLRLNFISWSVSHVPRLYNRVAHELAAMGSVCDPAEAPVLAPTPAQIMYLVADDLAVS
ncbi:hypothetical protein OsJ_20606 [Oryza sativa Japonica Group]|uniref:RNase H type-1 domain-containing protein n=1 Tax=Oryza sativa subsp. japonica TaxID=39947 RepID=A3B9P5_ORYSJ|nr:hypothetical protein OsJ_20606 [Oryza sativa Japonica Group]